MNHSEAEIEQLAARERHLARAARRAVRDHVPSSKTPIEGDSWKKPAQELLDTVTPDHLTYDLLKRIERHNLKVRRALSFRSLVVQESEKRRLGLRSTSWMLDEKIAAYRFVDRLDVRRPTTDLKIYRFEQLPEFSPSVVKPVRSFGSRGCYLVYSESEIIHVQDGAQFSSRKEMHAHAKTLMSGTASRRLRNRWFTEELVLEHAATRTPARDLKFFTFYGQVVMILEAQRTRGNSRYSFMLPDNTPIRPGSWNYEYYEGAGADASHLNLVEKISLEIPHPFSRIDMLKGEDELVFGEITPRPGGFQKFSNYWDRVFGEAWVGAQHRLQRDLMQGKRFDAFLTSTGYLSK